jgi:isopentenyldiphosphate isomerase
VSVFVMARDKVLIQRRALTKYHTPGLWANTCCTHPLRWDPEKFTPWLRIYMSDHMDRIFDLKALRIPV